MALEDRGESGLHWSEVLNLPYGISNLTRLEELPSHHASFFIKDLQDRVPCPFFKASTTPPSQNHPRKWKWTTVVSSRFPPPTKKLVDSGLQSWWNLRICKFKCPSKIKTYLVGPDHVGDIPISMKIVAGLTSGAIAIAIANPTDLINVWPQSEGKLPPGVPRLYSGSLNAYSPQSSNRKELGNCRLDSDRML